MATVAIQRGHCFRTRGSTGGPYEQETANDIAHRAVPLLEAAGHAVRLLTADQPVPLTDVFIALHCDAAGSPAAAGASVGYQDYRGRELARAWKDAYRANGWRRGWQRDNYTTNLARYYGVRKALAVGTPWACIVEHGFTTNPTEQRILRSDEGRDAAARALRDAVVVVAGGTDEEDDLATFEDYYWPREGAQSKRVQDIQRRLTEAFGRDVLGEAGADGKWGPVTTAAVGRLHPVDDRWEPIHQIRVEREIRRAAVLNA